MLMNKNLILSIALLLIFNINSFCQQDNNPQNENINIYLSPQHLIMNGVYWSIEKILADNKNSVIVSPQVFLRSYAEPRNSDRLKSVAGFGMELNFKHFLTDKRHTYFAYGPTYNYFSSIYNEYDWDLSGQEYHYTNRDRKRIINKIGMNTVVGLRSEIFERILIDVYSGVGLRYCFIEGEVDLDSFNNQMWDYEYTGTLLVIGMKIGVML